MVSHFKKKKKWWETITDADYASDLALLANKPAQSKFLLQYLYQAAKHIDWSLHKHR